MLMFEFSGRNQNSSRIQPFYLSLISKKVLTSNFYNKKGIATVFLALLNIFKILFGSLFVASFLQTH